MKELGVLFLMGPADSNDPNIPSYSRQFLAELSGVLGRPMVCLPREQWKTQELPVFFIASGGSEQAFRDACREVKPPYVLLTTPAYNSLAAAMEILGYLDERGERGEILHGPMEAIAERIGVLERVAYARAMLRGMRLGAIGKPSGLIASDADAEKLRAAAGMELIDLDLQELIDEYHVGGYEGSEYTRELKGRGYAAGEVEKALNVYGAAQRMVKRHCLQAVTVRCFDLLPAIGTTGCLALAILNSQGIPAACEGDAKSLISMAVSYALTGHPSFMANPSCLDPEKNEIVFAHCTLPLIMPDRYALTTHFESGIGVAVAGEVPPGPVTVFKCNDSLTRYYAGEGELLENLRRPDLCRTQLRLRMKGGVGYFTRHPISNHHMIVRGSWSEVFAEFFASFEAVRRF